MASLTELKKIQVDAITDPAGGDPDVVAANALLGKIEVCMWKRANFYLDDPGNDPTNGKVLIQWAARTMVESSGMAQMMLRLALGSPQAATATGAQIHALTDAQLEALINKLLPQLAQGMRLARS